MATVTVVTAERTLEIEATSIVDGEINAAGHLILTRQDGTPIDMGAVSGVQLDQGATYAKADVFSYVGDTDPGAVPDGSVWFDTNGPAGPFASAIQQGLVELATNAETITGTDDTRAVTPASFAAGLAAVPGTKVQIVTGIAEATTSSGYPVGTSIMDVSTWSISGGFGTVVTQNINEFRCQQTFYSASGGTSSAAMWIRHQNTADSGGGWTAWRPILTDPGAWTSWTPTWVTTSGNNTPSLGDAAVNCKYTKRGRLVTCKFDIVFGATTNFGAAPTGVDNWRFGLPVTAADATSTIGFLDLVDSSASTTAAGNANARVRMSTTGGFDLVISAGSPNGWSTIADSTQPWTWANGDALRGILTYESAA